MTFSRRKFLKVGLMGAAADGRPRYLIKAFYALLLEFPHFVMDRGTLEGVKERAERRVVAGRVL